MLGIDIMDLSDPLLKKREQSALRLISHPDDECPLIEDQFWLLWTAKESIFKAHRDLSSFDPKSIPVKMRLMNGKIYFTSGNYNGKVLREGTILLALASLNLDEILFDFKSTTASDESTAARQALERLIKDQLALDTKVISDGNGLPILDYENTPVSLSHHHQYIAYCCPRLSIPLSH